MGFFLKSYLICLTIAGLHMGREHLYSSQVYACVTNKYKKNISRLITIVVLENTA